MPPGNAGALTVSDYADLIAYMLAANGAKAGDVPLQASASFLEPLSLTATLPPLASTQPKRGDVTQRTRERVLPVRPITS